mgnify:CR=1 FL=1
MKARIEQRIAVHDGPNTQYLYIGDHFTMLRKDGVTICGTIVGIESDTIIIKWRYGDRPPWPVKVEDIKTLHRDTGEQGATNE